MRLPTPLRSVLTALTLLPLAACMQGADEAPPRVDPLLTPAGENPTAWAAEIARSIEARPDHDRPIVFLGSSSIRLWSTLAEDMAPLPVVNHGFGGSRIHDAIHWLGPVLEGLEPRALVVFSGTNDLAGDTPRDPAYVAERFDALVQHLRALGHDVPLLYLAISPTPSRERHLDRVLETNQLIAARCAADPLLEFVDTATALLGPDGRPDPRWFIGDLLHLNVDGYTSWTRTIRPALEGALERAPEGGPAEPGQER